MLIFNLLLAALAAIQNFFIDFTLPLPLLTLGRHATTPTAASVAYSGFTTPESHTLLSFNADSTFVSAAGCDGTIFRGFERLGALSDTICMIAVKGFETSPHKPSPGSRSFVQSFVAAPLPHRTPPPVDYRIKREQYALIELPPPTKPVKKQKRKQMKGKFVKFVLSRPPVWVQALSWVDAFCGLTLGLTLITAYVVHRIRKSKSTRRKYTKPSRKHRMIQTSDIPRSWLIEEALRQSGLLENADGQFFCEIKMVLNSAREDVEDSRSKFENERARANNLTARLDASLDELTELKEHIEVLSAEQRDHEHKHANLEAVKGDLKYAIEQRKDLEAKVKDLVTKADLANTETNRLNKEHSGALRKVHHLEQKLVEQQNEADNQATSLQAQVQEARAKISETESRMHGNYESIVNEKNLRFQKLEWDVVQEREKAIAEKKTFEARHDKHCQTSNSVIQQLKEDLAKAKENAAVAIEARNDTEFRYHKQCRTVSNLESQVRSANAEVRSFSGQQQNLGVKNAEVVELKLKLKDMEKKASATRNSDAELRQSLAEKDSLIAGLNQEIEKAQKDIAAIQKSRDSDLDDQRKKSDNTNYSLKKQLDQARAKIANVEKARADIDKSIAQRDSVIVNLELQLKQSKDNAIEAASSAEAAYEKLCTEANSKVSELDAQLRQSQENSLKATTSAKAAYDKLCKEASSKVSQLDAKLVQLASNASKSEKAARAEHERHISEKNAIITNLNLQLQLAHEQVTNAQHTAQQHVDERPQKSNSTVSALEKESEQAQQRNAIAEEQSMQVLEAVPRESDCPTEFNMRLDLSLDADEKTPKCLGKYRSSVLIDRDPRRTDVDGTVEFDRGFREAFHKRKTALRQNTKANGRQTVSVDLDGRLVLDEKTKLVLQTPQDHIKYRPRRRSIALGETKATMDSFPMRRKRGHYEPLINNEYSTGDRLVALAGLKLLKYKNNLTVAEANKQERYMSLLGFSSQSTATSAEEAAASAARVRQAIKSEYERDQINYLSATRSDRVEYPNTLFPSRLADILNLDNVRTKQTASSWHVESTIRSSLDQSRPMFSRSEYRVARVSEYVVKTSESFDKSPMSLQLSESEQTELASPQKTRLTSTAIITGRSPVGLNGTAKMYLDAPNRPVKKATILSPLMETSSTSSIQVTAQPIATTQPNDLPASSDITSNPPLPFTRRAILKPVSLAKKATSSMSEAVGGPAAPQVLPTTAPPPSQQSGATESATTIIGGVDFGRPVAARSSRFNPEARLFFAKVPAFKKPPTVPVTPVASVAPIAPIAPAFSSAAPQSAMGAQNPNFPPFVPPSAGGPAPVLRPVFPSSTAPSPAASLPYFPVQATLAGVPMFGHRHPNDTVIAIRPIDPPLVVDTAPIAEQPTGRPVFDMSVAQDTPQADTTATSEAPLFSNVSNTGKPRDKFTPYSKKFSKHEKKPESTFDMNEWTKK